MIGDVEWNQMWKDAIGGSSWGCLHGDGTEFWNKRTKQLEDQRKMNEDASMKIISKMDLDSKSTVMDIGAGTGALAIPLAKLVRHVTAVDPSSSMISYLERNAREENLKNITCVKKTWEDVIPREDVAEHDVLVASHSLLMRDMKGALEKMDLLARKTVYLITSARRDVGHYNQLWKMLYDKEYCPGPGYVYLYNILYEMGIYANVEISELVYNQPFSSQEDAMNLWIENLGASSPEAEEIVRGYMLERLVEEDGYFLLKDNVKWAVIWWGRE